MITIHHHHRPIIVAIPPPRSFYLATSITTMVIDTNPRVKDQTRNQENEKKKKVLPILKRRPISSPQILRASFQPSSLTSISKSNSDDELPKLVPTSRCQATSETSEQREEKDFRKPSEISIYYKKNEGSHLG